MAELTPELLGWLGSTDPELRDEFAYRILAAWIERGQYASRQLRTMAKQMTANLETGLGEHDTDSVYLPPPVLVLMEIVAFDNAHPFLDQADLDGYLGGPPATCYASRTCAAGSQGQAGPTPSATPPDLLMMLARSPIWAPPSSSGSLDVIADRLLTPVPGRLRPPRGRTPGAYATLNVLRWHSLVGRSWLKSRTDFTAAPAEFLALGLRQQAESAAQANVTHAFLRSLYFQLILTGAHPPTPSAPL